MSNNTTNPAEAVDRLNQLAQEFKDRAPATALKCCYQAEEIADKLHYIQGLSLSRILAGRCLWQMEEFEAAMIKFLQALRTYMEVEDEEGQMKVYHIIANGLYSREDYKKSLGYYAQSLDKSRNLHDNEFELMNLAAIGKAYEKLGDETTAMKYFTEYNRIKIQQDSIQAA